MINCKKLNEELNRFDEFLLERAEWSLWIQRNIELKKTMDHSIYKNKRSIEAIELEIKRASVYSIKPELMSIKNRNY